jgi:hypothetical protein
MFVPASALVLLKNKGAENHLNIKILIQQSVKNSISLASLNEPA